jgi:hypothetical protein
MHDVRCAKRGQPSKWSSGCPAETGPVSGEGTVGLQKRRESNSRFLLGPDLPKERRSTKTAESGNRIQATAKDPFRELLTRTTLQPCRTPTAGFVSSILCPSYSKSHLEQPPVSAHRNGKCLKANRLALFDLGLHDHAYLQPHTLAKPPVHCLKQRNSSRCASAPGQFNLIHGETRMKFLTNRAQQVSKSPSHSHSSGFRFDST